MKQQASLYDDEKLWLHYAQAFLNGFSSNPNFSQADWTTENVGISADAMVTQHRKRFPKAVKITIKKVKGEK